LKSKNLKHEKITRKWGGKTTQEEFETRISKWIEQFEENEKEFVCYFLHHFKYFTLRAIKDRAVDLFKLFEEKSMLNLDEVIFIPAYKELGVGFSDTFFNDFWYVNNLYDYAEKNIYDILSENIVFEKVVVVDDYSGSGKTIERTIRRCIEKNSKMKDSNFYILTLQTSNLARENLEKFSNDEGLDINIITLKSEKKAFENGEIFSNEKLKEIKNRYLNICDCKKINKDYKLGFSETEALLSFEYNTPNNTLGLFWSSSKDYEALFKRYKKKKTSLNQIRKDVSKRRKERESNFIKKYEENEQYVYLMGYLVQKGKKFNYKEAIKKFGMNEIQLDEAMNYLSKNDYVMYKSGKLVVTDKLREYIKLSKVKTLEIKLEETDNPSQKDNIGKCNHVPKKFGEKFKGHNN
jgi:hypothetical protein